MNWKVIAASGAALAVLGTVLYAQLHRPVFSRQPADVDPSVAIQGFISNCNSCHNDRYSDLKSVTRNAPEIFRRLRWIVDKPGTEPRLIDMPLGLSRGNVEDDKATFQAMVELVRPIAEAQPVLTDYPLDKLSVPPGFKVSLYAMVPGARTMAVAADGTLFVGTGGFSNPMSRIYRIKDWNGNHVIDPDEVEIFADHLNNPNGITIHGNSLYVAEQEAILEFANVIDLPRKSQVTRDQAKILLNLPKNDRHTWKYIRSAPAPDDNWLYYSVGAPCNVCDPDTVLKEQAAIHRVHLDGTGDEILARGVRNSQGFDFKPNQKLELWFTDNGRDELGDDFPGDELNKLSTPGEYFGWPRCNGDNVDDTHFVKPGFCAANATKPVVDLQPHAAALGMRFYRGSQFPEPYRSSIFIAEHGSWNRARKHGYKVVMVDPVNHVDSDFIVGWLDSKGDTDQTWGRPVDIEQMADGSLLISDDGIPDDGIPEDGVHKHDPLNALKGAIYRVQFVGTK